MSPCSGRSPLWTSGTDWCLTTWTRLRRTEAGTCIRSSLSILCPGTSYWLTLPRLKATTSASLSSSFPCSNLSPRAGRILDQLPGTAGSVSEPCSLGPWDAERAEGKGGGGVLCCRLRSCPGRRCSCRGPASLYLLSILVTGDGTPWQIPAAATASEQVPTLPL